VDFCAWQRQKEDWCGSKEEKGEQNQTTDIIHNFIRQKNPTNIAFIGKGK